MKTTSLPFRQAIIGALDGNVFYDSSPIRVWEEYVMETDTKRITTLGKGCDAYIILLNQTSNEDNSAKCNRNSNDSIQIQVTTVWPAGKGGSKTAEEISNVVLSLLFPTTVKNTDLYLGPDLQLWRSQFLSSININYDGDSSRTWITQLIIEGWISQH